MTELDYYPLAMAAKKTDYSEQLLIGLAAEDKLSLYVRLGGHNCLEIVFDIDERHKGGFCMNSRDEEGDYIAFPLGPEPKKVPTYAIQAFQNNSNASLQHHHYLQLNLIYHCLDEIIIKLL